MLRFYRKHYARGNNPALNALVYAGIVAKLGISLARTEILRLRRAS